MTDIPRCDYTIVADDASIHNETRKTSERRSSVFDVRRTSAILMTKIFIYIACVFAFEYFYERLNNLAEKHLVFIRIHNDHSQNSV